ncbi:MAG TPA: ABC transporter substrate-binding protein [Burkholderiaceae bacterium]|nr:ABC transporter substrate-binding protein [Burkholderiaceae bacterium]
MLLRSCLPFLLAVGAAVVAAKPLVYCADGSPEGFDPARWDSTITSNVTLQLFKGLAGYVRGTTTLKPELATGWTISPDAKTFTFALRRGVRFHSTPYFTPTREMNADDVLFTFRRMTDPKHPFHLAAPVQYVYAESLGLAQMIEGIDRVDDMTLRFRLKRPNVTFVNHFAAAFAGIHSAEYADKLLREGRASALNTWPIGAGPFKFKSYRKDDVLRLLPHEGYWAGPQKTTQLIFAISREPAVRVQKMAAGECHLTSPLRDIDIGALDKRGEVVILKKQALNISYLAFNLKKAPTDNRLVREALDIAIDRDALFKVLFPRGDAMQAVSAFPPAIAGYNTELKNEYNPERAKKLLADAGFAGGVTLDLWALPVTRPTNPNGMLMAQMIQQDWARIGVKATIRTYEWGEYLKRANNGEHHVYMSGWSGDTGEADDFLAPNLTCAASRDGIKFCNAEFDRLVETARATVDVDKRLAMVREAQAIFKRERPWITMAHSAIYIPVRRDVKGFVMAPNSSVDFEGVYRE